MIGIENMLSGARKVLIGVVRGVASDSIARWVMIGSLLLLSSALLGGV